MVEGIFLCASESITQPICASRPWVGRVCMRILSSRHYPSLSRSWKGFFSYCMSREVAKPGSASRHLAGRVCMRILSSRRVYPSSQFVARDFLLYHIWEVVLTLGRDTCMRCKGSQAQTFRPLAGSLDADRQRLHANLVFPTQQSLSIFFGEGLFMVLIQYYCFIKD
jgi:hypothetical protein